MDTLAVHCTFLVLATWTGTRQIQNKLDPPPVRSYVDRGENIFNATSGLYLALCSQFSPGAQEYLSRSSLYQIRLGLKGKRRIELIEFHMHFTPSLFFSQKILLKRGSRHALRMVRQHPPSSFLFSHDIT